MNSAQGRPLVPGMGTPGPIGGQQSAIGQCQAARQNCAGGTDACEKALQECFKHSTDGASWPPPQTTAPAPTAPTQGLSKPEVIANFGIQAQPNASELTANPFVYKDKVIGLLAIFGQI